MTSTFCSMVQAHSMRQLRGSTYLVMLSVFTSMATRLRDLSTSKPARVNTPITSADMTCPTTTSLRRGPV